MNVIIHMFANMLSANTVSMLPTGLGRPAAPRLRRGGSCPDGAGRSPRVYIYIYIYIYV